MTKEAESVTLNEALEKLREEIWITCLPELLECAKALDELIESQKAGASPERLDCLWEAAMTKRDSLRKKLSVREDPSKDKKER